MSQKVYWKGVEELEKTPQFLERADKEFAEELPVEDVFGGSSSSATSRRDFLKLMGFGVSAAVLAASCRIPVRKAIPYIIKPEEITPGVSTWYASSYIDGSDYCSIVVKTREGRPIKIEGNDLSDVTMGGTNARAQASIITLYDKFRHQSATADGKPVQWDDVDADLKKQLTALKDKEGNIVLMSSTILSPSTQSVINEFCKVYNAKHVVYESISYSAMLTANDKSFGKKAIPTYSFDNADVIVGIAADFLGTWLAPVTYTKQYVKGRKINPEHPHLSRHIHIESRMSLTGSNADERITVKPSQLALATLQLYNAIAGKGNVSGLSDKAIASINTTAAELKQAKGKALVVSGLNDINVQTLVNAINAELSSYGNTINLDKPMMVYQSDDAAVAETFQNLSSGKTAAILFYNCNPAYDYYDTSMATAAIKKAQLSVSLNGSLDETSAACKYVCPDSHYLESWNDAEPIAGHYSLVQPTISAIYNTRQAPQSLMRWADIEGDYYSYIQKYWEKNVYPSGSEWSFQAWWDKTLKDGVYSAGSESKGGDYSFKGDIETAVGGAMKAASNAKGLEVILYEKIGIGNGKYANNPWLHEMPDPISKVGWDNYLCVTYKWAKENKVDNGDVATLSLGKTSVDLPIYIQPGQSNGTVAVALGYGRTIGGRCGTGIGKNVFSMVAFDGTFNYNVSGATVTVKKGEKDVLAITQTNYNININELSDAPGEAEKRNVIREYATLAEYKTKHEEEGKDYRKEYEEIRNETLYEKYPYQGIKWGMSIDLNSCIGCAACFVACTSENNVPVVGKKEMIRGHEMHWMRIDRYYSLPDYTNKDADYEDVEVSFQPMLCQHCENAPCENVCPVNATNHSSEGLNQMAYNRCIGTRYCANNCPYKVRRFNWLDFTTADSFPWNTAEANVMMIDELTRMVLNPDVTVRSRGVIEKCSFCVQRLQDAKLTAKKEERHLKDGDARTACQTACPAEAISFGNILDTESDVYKKQMDDRNYFVLDEIHTLPSIGYLKKVRNKREENKHSQNA